MYDLTDGIISFEEHELIKTKQGVDSKLKKTWKKQAPPPLTDTDLELLIGTFIYTYASTTSLSAHSTQLLAALLELKRRRAPPVLSTSEAS